jgi:hypothetical protein
LPYQPRTVIDVADLIVELLMPREIAMSLVYSDKHND